MKFFPFREKLPRGYDEDLIYISKPFPYFMIAKGLGEEYREKKEEGKIGGLYSLPYGSKYHSDYVRAASIFINSSMDLKYQREENGVVLRKTPTGTQEVRAEFTEFDRRLHALVFQRFNTKTGTPYNNHFSFVDDEIIKLKDFLNSLDLIPIKGEISKPIKISDIKDINEIKKFINENEDLVKELMNSEIDRGDIAILKHRKKQLNTFKRMLEDDDYFDNLCKRKSKGKEGLWQEFFEKNDWIFGYGLSYIFSSKLDSKKLEQYVSGFDFNERGKRVDAILKTRGIINSFRGNEKSFF